MVFQKQLQRNNMKIWRHEQHKLHVKYFTVFVSSMHRFQTFKGPRGVSGGSEPSPAMAEPTKQERLTKLMEALEAFDEVEFEIQCFGYAQVEDKISDYCRTFAPAEVDLKDEEIQCKEDFALFIAHSYFWQNLRSPDFRSHGESLETLRTVVDHLKVLLQPPVADWQKKTLSALARTFRQVFEQSGILNFYEFCSKVTPRCGDRESGQVAFSQPGISLARKMREEVIQVAKMALRTQQFKTAINDDLSAAIKDFLHEVRIWCNEAEDAIKHDPKRDIYTVCSDSCSNSFHTQRGCRKTLLLRRFHELQSFNYGTVRVARGFSEYKRPWEKLRDATSKLLDLSLASELQNSDPQRDMSATSLSSWSLIDVVDRNGLEVESIASCNSVDSQTSCLSASGGPHCFLPTCRFKCVEDETSLVREVLGKDAKLLKHVPLVTKIHLWLRFYIPDSRWYHLGGGFEYFYFHPYIYFSKGLKPPIIQIQVLCGALVLL